MTKYNELLIKRQKSPMRAGRGISAGRGKTAGRGTKGQGARKSGGVRPGFEGGQMPIYMRLPHLRGFKSHRTPIENVYTGQLAVLKQSAIDNKTLFESGLITSPYSRVKLITKGELNLKKDVKLQAASAQAVNMLQKAGGSFTQTERQARPKKAEAKAE